MVKKTISLSSPAGNVFNIIGYIVEHCLEDQSKRDEVIKHFIDLGSYDKIIEAVKAEYGDFIEIVD
ncbi:hypothetical protein D3C80_955390 [compost metagenome]